MAQTDGAVYKSLRAAGTPIICVLLIQSIQCTFASEDADRAADILRELRVRSLAESGVPDFEVGRSKERPAVFALWEEYRYDEALKSHVATEHFQRLVINGVRWLAKERRAETVFPS